MTPDERQQQIDHCIFREAYDAFFVLVPSDLRIVEANPAAQRLTGFRRKQLLGLTLRDLLECGHDGGLEPLISAAQTTSSLIARDGYLLVTSDGRRIPAHVTISRIHTEPEPLALVIIRDLSLQKQAEERQRQLEERMQQTQRLESLGLLAGGIAHDFNNLLTAILGFADLALLTLPLASPARDNIEHVIEAARHAAELTGQMLAYSGRGRFQVQCLPLTDSVRGMFDLLKMSVSKKAILHAECAEDTPWIEADAGQLRQVVMNLIINASDAMGGQDGVITVRTGSLVWDGGPLPDSFPATDLPAGRFAVLEVTDTGCGMTAETRAKIFDPFFTTKRTGRGLGLAAVLGIVRSHRGAIQVTSEPDRGSTFRVLFPACQAVAAPAPAASPSPAAQGRGTILVVDDEDFVRSLAQRMLQRLGFEVLTARDGCEGLQVYRTHRHDIAAVVLDLTMPGLDGVETMRELRRIDSDVPVLLSSGYGQVEGTERLAGQTFTGFVAKPFSLEKLSQALLNALVP